NRHASDLFQSALRRLYADRTSGRHCRHLGSDCAALAGRAAGSRGCPPGYVSSISTTVLNPCNADQELQNGVDLGTGWAWGSMILPYLDQQPVFSSINFNLSVAYHDNDTCSLTSLAVYLCPSDGGGPLLVPVFKDPPDPNNPGTYSANNIVDTLARGNYVGMWG